MSTLSSPLLDLDPTAGPLAKRPYPELAEALRGSIAPILDAWEAQLRAHVPRAVNMTFEQLRDSVPEILERMADAFASGRIEEIRKLMDRSPSQGIQRFQLHYDTWDLATEDRMLRLIIVDQVGKYLGRRLTLDEDAALHWAIDLMAQQAMVHFVNHQNAKLRIAAEAELQYLSFLSHDLNGNLGNITLWLQVLKSQLANHSQFAEQMASVDTAQQAILDTMGGMGRLLQAERLRHSKTGQQGTTSIDLHTLVQDVVAPFIRQGQQKGVAVIVELPPQTATTVEGDLIRLVLQNLLGNAVKYSKKGTVRLAARVDHAAKCWTLSVSDEGPGIGPDHVERIFEAFQRGEMHGQAGVGLGLAIASRAAKLLEAELTVESHLGQGTTFRFHLPRGLLVLKDAK
jgi:signal transduction histidine kinase